MRIPEKDQFILPRGRGQRGSFTFWIRKLRPGEYQEREKVIFSPPRSVAKPKRDPRTLTRRSVPLSVSQRPVCSVGCLLHFDNPDAQDPERPAGALLGPGPCLWNGTGQPAPSLCSATWAAWRASGRRARSPPGLASWPWEVMPPSSFEQLLLARPGSDKQADVLGATSLTQRVWELRYSVPGGRGAAVRSKDGTCAADSLFSMPLFQFEEAGKTWEMKELSAQDGVQGRRRVCSPSSHPCSP